MQGQRNEDSPLEERKESPPQSLPKNCAYPGLMAVLETMHQLPELSPMGGTIGDLKRRISTLPGKQISAMREMIVQAGGTANLPQSTAEDAGGGPEEMAKERGEFLQKTKELRPVWL